VAFGFRQDSQLITSSASLHVQRRLTFSSRLLIRANQIKENMYKYR